MQRRIAENDLVRDQMAAERGDPDRAAPRDPIQGPTVDSSATVAKLRQENSAWKRMVRYLMQKQGRKQRATTEELRFISGEG